MGDRRRFASFGFVWLARRRIASQVWFDWKQCDPGELACEGVGSSDGDAGGPRFGRAANSRSERYPGTLQPPFGSDFECCGARAEVECGNRRLSEGTAR